MMNRTLPVSYWQLVATAVAGAGAGCAFCFLLGRYWSFYHLLTGGNFVFLLVLPLAIATGSFLAVASTIVLARRGVPGRRGVPWSVALVIALALSAFAAEIVRTHDLRSAEGEGAGDLAPFFRSLAASN